MEKKMNKTDKAIEKYCDMMIKRISEPKRDGVRHGSRWNVMANQSTQTDASTTP